MLKEIFALSDQGEKDLKKGIVSSAAANISLILPAGLLLLTIKDLMKYIEKINWDNKKSEKTSEYDNILEALL